MNRIGLVVLTSISACWPTQAQPPGETIRAYNIDYNWNSKAGYINDFAKPGCGPRLIRPS